jgi:hypothetical protein
MATTRDAQTTDFDADVFAVGGFAAHIIASGRMELPFQLLLKIWSNVWKRHYKKMEMFNDLLGECFCDNMNNAIVRLSMSSLVRSWPNLMNDSRSVSTIDQHYARLGRYWQFDKFDPLVIVYDTSNLVVHNGPLFQQERDLILPLTEWWGQDCLKIERNTSQHHNVVRQIRNGALRKVKTRGTINPRYTPRDMRSQYDFWGVPVKNAAQLTYFSCDLLVFIANTADDAELLRISYHAHRTHRWQLCGTCEDAVECRDGDCTCLSDEYGTCLSDKDCDCWGYEHNRTY